MPAGQPSLQARLSGGLLEVGEYLVSPTECESGAVGAAAMSVTAGKRWTESRCQRPGEAICARKQVAVKCESRGLDAESVCPDPGNACVNCGEDRSRVGGALPATDRADPHHERGCQVHSGVFVPAYAVEVFAAGPPLKNRDEGQVWRDAPQSEVVHDGPALVLGDRLAGGREHLRLAHPILRRGPYEPTDLIVVALDPGGVRVRWAAMPAAISGQFGEPAGVQRPQSRRGWQRPITTQRPIGDEQRHFDGT